MSLVSECLAWLRHALGRREKPTFGRLLDEAMEKPFVSFSARALEQAMQLEQRANPNQETPNPQQSAQAGAIR